MKELIIACGIAYNLADCHDEPTVGVIHSPEYILNSLLRDRGAM